MSFVCLFSSNHYKRWNILSTLFPCTAILGVMSQSSLLLDRKRTVLCFTPHVCWCCWSSLVNPHRVCTQNLKSLRCSFSFDHTLIMHVHFRIQELVIMAHQGFRLCKSSWVNAARSNPFTSGNPWKEALYIAEHQ